MIPLSMIDNVILDCDGVLTDGKQYIDPDGNKLFKKFCGRDIKAIRWLNAMGVYVAVISADDWSGAVFWAHRVGADFVHARDKVEAIKRLELDPERTVMIGDDAWDMKALEYVAYPFAPMDGEACLSRVKDLNVLRADGGEGVVARLVEQIDKES